MKAESREKKSGSRNCFGHSGSAVATASKGASGRAVGSEPGSESQVFPPYRGAGETGGGLEQAGAGIFLATPSPFLPPRNAPIFFEWCFGNNFQALRQYPAHCLHLPLGVAVRAEKVLAPNPAKLLLTCVLCVLQTFHSAIASEARNPC